MRSLRVCPGRVRGHLQCPAREQISTDLIRRFRCSRGFHHRVWIASSWPATADLIFNINVRQFRGERPLLSSTTSGNSGAHACCRHLYVRQFQGMRPLPSVFPSGNLGARARCRQSPRLAISEHAPVAASSTFGNSGASARCHQFSRLAIPGHAPVAVNLAVTCIVNPC